MRENEADFSKVPGVVINHSPARSERYIGSPSIAMHPGGRYVASNDYFGPGGDRGRYNSSVIFSSSDRGETWEKLASLEGQFWSTLFTHRGTLYLIGTSGKDGDITIRRSTDGGRGWTVPEGEDSGILARGRYHCAPVPVVVHRDRVWRAMEDRNKEGQRPFMMSAPVDSDLLRSSSWTFSGKLESAPHQDHRMRSWREGNAVVKPDGGMAIVMRIGLKDGHSTAALIDVSDDGRHLRFDPADGYVEFPGGTGKKFTIRLDPETERYWSVVNPIQPRDLVHLEPTKAGAFRNCLAVSSSEDLRRWQVLEIIAYHPEFRNHAFQYPDWIFDGDDIAAVSRTAYDDGLGGAANRHDANFMTFHRIRDFRRLVNEAG